MSDSHRISGGVISDAKRRALRGYDAWVEQELGGGGVRRVKYLVGFGVAATIVITAVVLWKSTGEAPSETDRGPAAPFASPADQDMKEAIRAYVRQLPLPQHIEVVGIVRAELDRRLLAPAPKWLSRKPERANAGVNRILNRGRFEQVTLVRGGGAYFSFSTESNDFDHAPDLGLEQWSFYSGFSGSNFGIVEVLPVDSLDGVTMQAVPSELLTMPAASLYDATRRVRRPRPPAMVGKVYVIRSVRWGRSDLIAAFEVLERDKDGVTFAWKVVKTLPIPERR
jgi:hypothetical protein